MPRRALAPELGEGPRREHGVALEQATCEGATEPGARAPRRRRGGMAVVLGGVAVVLLLAESSVGQRVMQAAGLSRQHTSVVSLYFPDAADLPAKLGPSHELDLRFALHATETAASSYTWSAETWKGKLPNVLASGAVRLAPGGTAVVTRTVRVPCTGRRVAVHVTLRGTSTGIDLWLACPPRR